MRIRPQRTKLKISKRVKYFDIEKFLGFTSRKQKPVETKDISNWLDCSVRYIQKYASENEVPFTRIHGRKYYLWNEDSIREFATRYNQNYTNEKEIKIELNGTKEKTKKKEKKKVSFRTIKDLVIELYNKEDVYKIRTFQNWAKIFGVPFQYHFGRKYYLISDEIKDIFIELDKNREFYYKVFPKNKHIKMEFQDYHNKSSSKFIPSKDLDILIKIAKEQE